jgi:hypothetical protein
MARLHELAGEEATAAADLHHETTALPYRFEELENPRRTRFGVKGEALVVDQSEVTAVVGAGERAHMSPSCPPWCRRAERGALGPPSRALFLVVSRELL